jgi:magnesium transporter
MIVDCAVYDNGTRRDGPLRIEEAYDAGHRDGSFVWIGLYEPTEEEFDAVRREFNLHELAVEDAIHAHQRPKLEVYGDSLFVVLKPARYADHEEVVELGEILVFVGDSFIVTVRHGDVRELSGVRQQLEKRKDLLQCGPSSVLYAILDRVVDDYQPVIEGVQEDIDQVEREVFSTSRRNPTERIFKLKREVLEFYRAAAPLVDPLERLVQSGMPEINEKLKPYLRDVYDHQLRVVSQVEGFRELLNGILTANLTQIGVRQNEDMRRISAWVAIIAVPTALAGIYGMNFEHMPELKWELGYPAVLLLMLTICTGLYRYFKKVGWL